jgi:hypothetical protein
MWGGSRAGIYFPSAPLPHYCPSNSLTLYLHYPFVGINPYVIWRIPSESKIEERDEGITKSQKNIVFLHRNTSLYHTLAERTVYLAYVVNKNFLHNVAAAQATYEFITSDKLSVNFVNPYVAHAFKFALNCQDPNIVLELRKLNARPKNEIFDQFWAIMATTVNGGVSDWRHGKLLF